VRNEEGLVRDRPALGAVAFAEVLEQLGEQLLAVVGGVLDRCSGGIIRFFFFSFVWQQERASTQQTASKKKKKRKLHVLCTCLGLGGTSSWLVALTTAVARSLPEAEKTFNASFPDMALV